MAFDPPEIVTPGLDPGAHLTKMMDGRIKSGHDRSNSRIMSQISHV